MTNVRAELNAFLEKFKNLVVKSSNMIRETRTKSGGLDDADNPEDPEDNKLNSDAKAGADESSEDNNDYHEESAMAYKESNTVFVHNYSDES